MTSTSDQEAIDWYLRAYSPDNDSHSNLESLLRDANHSIGTPRNPGALWLGALGYLVAIELLGRHLKLRDSPEIPAGRNGKRPDRELFKRAITDFGLPQPLADTGDILYALRCALAHNFSLKNVWHNSQHLPVEHPLTRAFTLHRGVIFIKPPADPWDGNPATGNSARYQTAIGVWGIGYFAKTLVARARECATQGDVCLAEGLTADQLLAFGGFTITGED